MHRSATARLLRVTALVAAGDAITKSCAAAWLAGRAHPGSWVGLYLVHNDQGAFGLSVGAYTWQVNLALTLGAIALVVPVCRALESVDGRAPEALGLIAGGALGNLLSLVLSPFGVLDFIAVRTGAGSAIVLNAADIGAYAGLAMLVRTTWRLVTAISQPATTADRMIGAEGVLHVARPAEAEVAVQIFVEPSMERGGSARERPVARRAPRADRGTERRAP
jgi:lipoprotein signal peptidase